jgi:hypothetical protein
MIVHSNNRRNTMLKPEKVTPRVDGKYEVVVETGEDRYVVLNNNGFLSALEHTNADGKGYHYDVVLGATSPQALIELGASVVASLMDTEYWPAIALGAFEMFKQLKAAEELQLKIAFERGKNAPFN